jgi:trigger factor
MQVTETLSERLTRAYTVVLPGAEIESRRARRLADLGRTMTLPGFRPGKVPLPVMRTRFGSAVAAEVMEESVQEAVQKVLDERGVRPALQPKIDFADPAGASAATGPARDLEFKLEVELLPEIPLPDFATLSLVRLKADVSDETVQQALTNLTERNRSFEDISAEELGKRGAANGEYAVVDYVGRIDGAEFPGGTGKDMPVEIGGTGFIPGFAAQLEGIRPGDARTIAVRFPEDYGASEVAGREAQFEQFAGRSCRN